MLIGNLEKDTEVTIHVTDGVKAVQLSSQVLELSKTDLQECMVAARRMDYQSFIGIQAIRVGERIVSFSSENITCTITALKDNKPYSWKNVVISASSPSSLSSAVGLSDIVIVFQNGE